MNKRIISTHLFRILVIIALVIPLTFGATFPAKAAFDGTEIITWGYNGGGQYTTPSGLTDVIAIDAGGHHNLALRSDGTVVAWGENFHGQLDVPADLSGVVAIAAGAAHGLALKGDGTVVAWGFNRDGETDVPSDLTDVVAIGAGSLHSLALKSDGTLVGWGNNGFNQITIPEGLTDVVAFSVGHSHNLALKADGTVVAWGYNHWGQTNVPEGLANVLAIAAGSHHNLALKNDGTVVAWGDNTYHETEVPAGLTGVVAIAAGGGHSLALKNDGTVVGWGKNDYSQSSPPSTVSGAAGIYAGENHSIALVPADSPLNTAPVANPGGSYLGAVNTSISFDGSLSFDSDGDPLTYTWDFGDGATGTGVTPTHSYTTAGVYTVCLIVNDGSLSSTQACTLAVVYDPSAGFVTGGGWIDSPAGAYQADETLAGKATFGFVSKYQKGTNIPTGNTAFEFDLAGLAFSSQSYDWLVVSRTGTNAQFKGSGLINGAAAPNGNAYKFMLWAGDGSSAGSADTFRIRIWWEDAAGEHDMYDNGVDQPIAGGSIVIHAKK